MPKVTQTHFLRLTWLFSACHRKHCQKGCACLQWLTQGSETVAALLKRLCVFEWNPRNAQRCTAGNLTLCCQQNPPVARSRMSFKTPALAGWCASAVGRRLHSAFNKLLSNRLRPAICQEWREISSLLPWCLPGVSKVRRGKRVQTHVRANG